MTYQIADLINGPFGDTYSTLREAEKALAECIEEGKALNIALGGQECGTDGASVESFFAIVDQYGEQI
jgi:hypothetical protein